jgi:hypothetical protein
MGLTGLFSLLVLAVALVYFTLRAWRERDRTDSTDKSSGFRPRIGFTRLDGMASLSLLLINKSSENVWVEEVEIFLSGLIADQQTAEASGHEIQKIRQMVRPGDTLPISLAEVIYKAAGDPQRKYSCILSSVLHYRIDEEWSDKRLENYKIQMIGLTASGIQRARQPVPPFPTMGKTRDVPEPATKSK